MRLFIDRELGRQVPAWMESRSCQSSKRKVVRLSLSSLLTSDHQLADFALNFLQVCLRVQTMNKMVWDSWRNRLGIRLKNSWKFPTSLSTAILGKVTRLAISLLPLSTEMILITRKSKIWSKNKTYAHSPSPSTVTSQPPCHSLPISTITLSTRRSGPSPWDFLYPIGFLCESDIYANVSSNQKVESFL